MTNVEIEDIPGEIVPPTKDHTIVMVQLVFIIEPILGIISVVGSLIAGVLTEALVAAARQTILVLPKVVLSIVSLRLVTEFTKKTPTGVILVVLYMGITAHG